MYRLGERVRLDLPEPYSGATVEVDSVVSRVIAMQAVALASAFLSGGESEFAAMSATFEMIVAEARPTWDIVDHKGPVPVTVAGFMRLPMPLALAIFDGWTDTLLARDKVDSAGPDGGAPVGGASDAEIALAKKRIRRVA